MSNLNELRAARKRAAEAAESLARIEALPRAKGSQVVWGNWVIWTRLGDDDWRPDSDQGFRYSSAHVASLDWAKPDTDGVSA